MAVKYFDWDDSKNASSGRNGTGFEDIVFHIERGGLLDILEHPKPDRYSQPAHLRRPGEDYVYLVPFIEDDTRCS